MTFICAFQLINAQKKPFHDWELQNAGLSYSDGNISFFDGFTPEILYTNSVAGLPVYTDWKFFTSIPQSPAYWKYSGHVGFAKPSKNLRFRVSGSYFEKIDSLAGTIGFFRNDTVAGRLANEQARYVSLSLAGMKTTIKLLDFFRFYVGIETELAFSPKSKIDFLEYEYDLGDNAFVMYNEFHAKGNPRLNAFGSAVLGMETVFYKRFGIFAEIQSGLGTHILAREKPVGMAKIAWNAGLQYYFFDYQGQKRRVPTPETSF